MGEIIAAASTGTQTGGRPALETPRSQPRLLTVLKEVKLGEGKPLIRTGHFDTTEYNQRSLVVKTVSKARREKFGGALPRSVRMAAHIVAEADQCSPRPRGIAKTAPLLLTGLPGGPASIEAGCAGNGMNYVRSTDLGEQKGRWHRLDICDQLTEAIAFLASIGVVDSNRTITNIFLSYNDESRRWDAHYGSFRGALCESQVLPHELFKPFPGSSFYYAVGDTREHNALLAGLKKLSPIMEQIYELLLNEGPYAKGLAELNQEFMGALEADPGLKERYEDLKKVCFQVYQQRMVFAHGMNVVELLTEEVAVPAAGERSDVRLPAVKKRKLPGCGKREFNTVLGDAAIRKLVELYGVKGAIQINRFLTKCLHPKPERRYSPQEMQQAWNKLHARLLLGTGFEKREGFPRLIEMLGEERFYELCGQELAKVDVALWQEERAWKVFTGVLLQTPLFQELMKTAKAQSEAIVLAGASTSSDTSGVSPEHAFHLARQLGIGLFECAKDLNQGVCLSINGEWYHVRISPSPKYDGKKLSIVKLQGSGLLGMGSHSQVFIGTKPLNPGKHVAVKVPKAAKDDASIGDDVTALNALVQAAKQEESYPPGVPTKELYLAKKTDGTVRASVNAVYDGDAHQLRAGKLNGLPFHDHHRVQIAEQFMLGAEYFFRTIGIDLDRKTDNLLVRYDAETDSYIAHHSDLSGALRPEDQRPRHLFTFTVTTPGTTACVDKKDWFALGRQVPVQLPGLKTAYQQGQEAVFLEHLQKEGNEELMQKYEDLSAQLHSLRERWAVHMLAVSLLEILTDLTPIELPPNLDYYHFDGFAYTPRTVNINVDGESFEVTTVLSEQVISVLREKYGEHSLLPMMQFFDRCLGDPEERPGLEKMFATFKLL